MLPDFFLSFDQNEPFLFLPEIDLSKTKIAKFFLKNFNSTYTFNGLLNDTSIDIENGEYIFKTSFKDIEFNSKSNFSLISPEPNSFSLLYFFATKYIFVAAKYFVAIGFSTKTCFPCRKVDYLGEDGH